MANANHAVLIALALTAIVTFAEVSAYRTTTIEDDNGFPPYVDGLPTEEANKPREQCRWQIQGQQLNHCHMHLITQQSTSFDSMLQEDQHLQQCCDQLKQVNERCQCEAIQNVVQQAQMQQQQQGGQHQMLRKAQMLPNQCKLQLQRCPIQFPNRV